MSEQDQDELILRAVKDARAAREELNFLRQKANEICDAMFVVLAALRQQAGGDPTSSTGRQYVELAVAYQRIPSGPEIKELADKIKAAAERDAELAKRKQQLGI